MNESPFFTILTASFNNVSTIKHTLISIKCQTFQNIEHIVIDGGSKDGTLDILKKFRSLYNLIWVSESDNGISEALNKGLKLAKGKYILIIHADDCLLTPNVLKIIYGIIKNEECDIYSFPVLKNFRHHGLILYKPIRALWWHHFKTIFPHQGSFIHQRIYNLVGGYREKFSIALDYDFFYRALKYRCSVKFENQPVALMGGTGISSNDAYLTQRLQEEIRVQRQNEKNPFWRIAQILFWMFYIPYKTKLAPKLRIAGDQKS